MAASSQARAQPVELARFARFACSRIRGQEAASDSLQIFDLQSDSLLIFDLQQWQSDVRKFPSGLRLSRLSFCLQFWVS